MKSRLLEWLVKSWLTTTQALTLFIGLGLVLYLVLRPMWPGAVQPIEAHLSLGSTISTWPALLGNTLLIAGVATAMSVSLALPLSYLLFRTNLPGRVLFTLGLLLLACLPVFVTSSAVMALLGFRTSQGNPLFAGLIHGWIGTPLALLQIGLGYLCVNRELEEAASCETSRFGVWTNVDWPQIRWCVLAVGLLQIWFSGTEVTVSDMLCVRTFAEEVYLTYQLSGSTAMQSLVVAPFLALFGLLVLGIVCSAKRADIRSTRVFEARPPRLQLHAMRWPLTVLVGAVVAVLVYFPLHTLVSQVDSVSDFVRLSRRLGAELRQSLLLAGMACLLTLVLTMGIFVRAMSQTRRGRCLRWSLVLLFAWPSPCLAIALIECLNRPGPLGAIYDSPAALVLGQTLRWLPLCVLLTAPALIGLSRDVVEAARADGCDGARLHSALYWPIAKSFLLLAGTAVFILVLSEVTISVLLSPPGFLPMSVRFFTLVHYGLRNEAATICGLMVLVLLLPWSVLVYMLHRPER